MDSDDIGVREADTLAQGLTSTTVQFIQLQSTILNRTRNVRAVRRT